MFSKFLKSALIVLSFVQIMMVNGEAMENRKTVEVAIIGGGMAGLTTAYNLNKKGVMVELFEAKDHLGGRTHTHYFNKNQFYEEGGTTIDAEHLFVIDLANELGVKLEEINYADGKISGIWKQTPLSSKDFLDTLTELVTEMNNYSNGMGKKSLNDIELTPRTKAYLRNYIRDECGIELENCPINFRKWVSDETETYIELIEYKNCWYMPNCVIGIVGYFYRVAGGMSQFVNSIERSCKMNDRTKFNINYALKKIEYQNNEYYLTFDTEHGEEMIIAKKVVMTIPFSVLGDVEGINAIGLSDFQLKAIKTLRYGTNAKIGVPVTGSFDMRFYFSLDQNLNAWPGHNAITFMLGGKDGRDIGTPEGKSPEDFVNAESLNLHKDYPKIGKFTGIAFKNWSQDPFARGSYSAKTTEDSSDLWYGSSNFMEIYTYKDKDGNDKESKRYLVNTFAEPINNNTFIFAGEHTRWGEDRAYIEGAVQSGDLAARIVLGEDTKLRRQKELPVRLKLREKF